MKNILIMLLNLTMWVNFKTSTQLFAKPTHLVSDEHARPLCLGSGNHTRPKVRGSGNHTKAKLHRSGTHVWGWHGCQT